MRYLPFYKTKDSDLMIYLKVVYQDKGGQWTKTGTITQKEKISGQYFYTVNTSIALRVADDFKLIEATKNNN